MVLLSDLLVCVDEAGRKRRLEPIDAGKIHAFLYILALSLEACFVNFSLWLEQLVDSVNKAHILILVCTINVSFIKQSFSKNRIILETLT